MNKRQKLSLIENITSMGKWMFILGVFFWISKEPVRLLHGSIVLLAAGAILWVLGMWIDFRFHYKEE